MAVVQTYKEMKKPAAGCREDNARVAGMIVWQESSYQVDHMTYLFFFFWIQHFYSATSKLVLRCGGLQRAQCLGHIYGREEYGVGEVEWWKEGNMTYLWNS